LRDSKHKHKDMFQGSLPSPIRIFTISTKKLYKGNYPCSRGWQKANEPLHERWAQS